ncbi:Nuclear RNA binding protein [Penicillium lagena]|uniref:Nuclear RNA binding protein n=1 Tax=Penicillium lagena TaxID=94218 RepID=UPI0025400245|nr:Nuclear RNA binding protein [Penicillium lagena]KAJ5620077.1 Nuclear RNA binding protein [Penicillium lagena]
MEVDQQPPTEQPQQQRTSRKHLRSSDDEDHPDWSSDVSGQFDDAEEAGPDDYRSPSAKSVKRRRSNDWPLPEESADYGSLERRGARAGYASLVGSTVGMMKASPRASPRGSLASLRNRQHGSGGSGGGGGGGGASSSPRHWSGRRSRFIEASMSDSVSEKPPSVFTREGKSSGSQRQSGIFRFGKAIAAAFNPFGSWGKATSPESNKPQPQTDALSQAEQAYAELKKSGYKGTNKGAYIQSQNVDSNMADQTWESIKENIDYGGDAAAVDGSGRHSTDHGGDRSTAIMPRRDSGASSKRSSFQDLRKAKIPFMKTHEAPSTVVMASEYNPDRMSEESEGPGIRRQRSRKELTRQAKLLKKVSNLEDKLDRARRELRELTGNEHLTSAPALPSQTETPAQTQSQPQPQTQVLSQPQSKTLCMEMDPESYPRKFVPGALPTLPSERLLDQQAAESESSAAKPSVSSVGANVSQEEESQLARQSAAPVAAIKSPKRRSKESSRPSSMGKDSSSSSSRKRKSPVPESLGSGKSAQSRATESIDNDDDALKEKQQLLADYEFMLSPPPRQAKWQKFEAGDSPGSVERKRTANEDDPDDAAAAAARKMSPYQTRRRSATPPLRLSHEPLTKFQIQDFHKISPA